MRRAVRPGMALLLFHSFVAIAQSPYPEAMMDLMEARALGLAGTEHYLKVTNSLGPQIPMADAGLGPCAGKICQAVAVTHTTLPGTSRPAAAEVPQSPEETAVRAGMTSSEILEAMGAGLVGAQEEINRAMGMEGLGIEDLGIIDGPVPDDPLLMLLNPTTALERGGLMIVNAAGAAAAAEESVRNTSSQGQSAVDQAGYYLGQMRFAGAAVENGIEVHRYEFGEETSSQSQSQSEQDEQDPDSDGDGADPPSNSDSQNEVEPEISSGMIVIDPERHRILRHRFGGTMATEGESRDFFIEVEYSDFRNPPGCGQMDEPFRRVMRMGGMLGEEEMAQMEEARAQLAEFEQQLATMPAQQRQTMERMMGPQMEQMRNLISGGGFEYVEETEQVICNPDLASLFSVGNVPAVNIRDMLDADEDLVRQIQEYLVILGYEPGNIEGILDDLTRVAISQFQAEQGFPVTGEPSTQLAAQLLAAVTG